jgi:ribonuclease E
MADKMLIDASHPEETRVVVTRGNRIEEFDFETAAKRQLKGNIYLAKVTRVEPSLQAAFVDFGGNRHGFLAFSEIHPDYYQIPVADREALLAEEAARQRRENDDDDGRPQRKSRGKPKRGRKEESVSADDAAAENGAPAEEENGENGEEEEDAVEQVGGGDALEELPSRGGHQFRRPYKIQEVVKRRQILLVQVVKEERGTKGAALTTYLSLAGRYSVLMPNTARGGGISRKITNNVDRKRLKEIAGELEVPDGMGVILRTAGAARTKAEIKRDFEYLSRVWENVRELTLQSTAPSLVYEEGSLIKRAIRDLYSKDIDDIQVAGEAGYREAKDFMKMLMPSHAKLVQHYREPQPLFARYGVEGQLDQMFSNVVNLKSGGYIVLNQTEALVSIDVNSGRATREHNIEDTALKTNMEAADEVARQLRLRDLAGLIVIDFIDMEEKRNNRSVERRMKECLKNDRARIQVGRISHFGLLEMSRQRIRASVLESTTVPCPHCGGTGFLRSTSSIALQVLRALEEALIKDGTRNLTLRTRSDVALYILNHKRAMLSALEQRFGVSLSVLIDEHVTGAQLYAIEKGEVVQRDQRPAEPVRAPVHVDDDNMIEAEIEEAADEEESADAGEQRPRNGDSEDENERKRRRRRRRRGGRDRDRSDRPAEARTPREETGASDDDDGEDDAEEAVGDSNDARPAGEAGEDGDMRRKRKRRRRGGRRNRRDREGEAGTGIAASGDDQSETALEAVEEETEAAAGELESTIVAEEEAKPKKGRGRKTKAAETKAADTKPVEAKAPKADASEAEVAPEAPAAAETSVEKPKRGRARAAKPKVAAEENQAPAKAVTAENSAPVVAEAAPPQAPTRRRPLVEVEPDEPEDSSQPKRAGWWSKARQIITGE